MSLRVLAIAPPQFACDPGPSRSLQSEDPASLFNACRVAATMAESGHGPWGDSNWAISRHVRRKAVLMLRSWREDQSLVRRCLEEIHPNLVLIGSMSICLPGAIACAQLVKDYLGDSVCVVLGGRHVCESMYLDGRGQVAHHASSPLQLMAQGLIPRVFDLVVSGDGESLIPALGELVASLENSNEVPAQAGIHLHELRQTPGHWIAGGFDELGRPGAVVSDGPSLDYDQLPAPCAAFGVKAKFNVFGGLPTAHVFSDVGSGCIYDCVFCSERLSASGALRQLETSAQRLVRQLQAAAQVIEEDYPGVGASAFVEDSTFLAFVPRLIERFMHQMTQVRCDIRIGAQLTIDQALFHPQRLRALRDVGLEYLFLGIETWAPEEIGGISKDVRRREGAWMDRVARALDNLAKANITAGVAVLFGLGETHASRMALIDQLRHWRRTMGKPYPISMNWAVQHPVRGHDRGAGYSYLEWAIPEGPFMKAFRDFGEASVRYPLAGKPAPALTEVEDVVSALADLLDPPRLTDVYSCKKPASHVGAGSGGQVG